MIRPPVLSWLFEFLLCTIFILRVTSLQPLHCPTNESISIVMNGSLKPISVLKGEVIDSVYRRFQRLYGYCDSTAQHRLKERIFRNEAAEHLPCPVDEVHEVYIDGTKLTIEAREGIPVKTVLDKIGQDSINNKVRYILAHKILRSPKATESECDAFLLRWCGRWDRREDQREHYKTGYVESRVAKFFYPLFPDAKAKDFFFPVMFEHDWVSSVVAACGVWEPGLTLLVGLALSPLNNASSSRLFVDAGAHMGWYSLFAAKVAQVPNVISFEPHPKTAHKNLQGIARNGVEHKILLSSFALSNASSGFLSIPSDSTVNIGGINTVQHSLSIGSNLKIMSTSLDHLNIQHARMIKVDVNKHVNHFLRGARDTIERRGFDYMIIEFEEIKKETIKELQHLIDHGYNISCLGYLSNEAGVYEQPTRGQVIRQHLRFKEELKSMLPYEQCSRRMRIVRGQGNGNAKVVQCVPGKGDQDLPHCLNAFIWKSEAALRNTVGLSQPLI